MLASGSNYSTSFGDVIANIDWIMSRMEWINREIPDVPIQNVVVEDRVEDEVIHWKSKMIMKQERKISKLMELIRRLNLRKCKFQPLNGK